jgi:predicted small lipoprotein YifL
MALKGIATLIVFTALAFSFSACGRKAPPVLPQQRINAGILPTEAVSTP